MGLSEPGRRRRGRITKDRRPRVTDFGYGAMDLLRINCVK